MKKVIVAGSASMPQRVGVVYLRRNNGAKPDQPGGTRRSKGATEVHGGIFQCSLPNMVYASAAIVLSPICRCLRNNTTFNKRGNNSPVSLPPACGEISRTFIVRTLQTAPYP